MYSVEMVVTPQMAKEWLEKNIENNRPLMQYRVKALVDDIRGGTWKRTSQGIDFDVNGRLLNGQHRLTAIVQAGIAVPLYVTYDVPEDAPFDTGAMRRASQVAKMRGLNISTREVGMAGYLITNLCQINGKEIILKFAKLEHQELNEIISMVNNKNNYGDKAACYAAIYVAIKNGVSKDDIKKIFHVVKTGMYSPGEEMVVYYRNWLIEKKKWYGHEASNAHFDITCRAIDDYEKGFARKQGYRENSYNGFGKKSFDGSNAESYIRKMIMNP